MDKPKAEKQPSIFRTTTGEPLANNTSNTYTHSNTIVTNEGANHNHNHNQSQNVETSYVLREYFKGFKLSPGDLMKVRDKINKTDRNALLDAIVKQNTEIYNIVAENYSQTINKVKYIIINIL